MNRRHPVLRRLLVLGLAAGLLLSLPSAAFAQEDTGGDRTDHVTDRETDRPNPEDVIRKAKARASRAIERRLETLSRLSAAVSGNGHVTEEHKRLLTADYQRSAAGLRRLAGEIEAAQTLPEVLRLSALIVTDYRIYVVVVPKSHEVVASDTLVDIADRFREVSGNLQAAIDRAREAGFEVAEAQRWLDVAKDEIAEAGRNAGPVAGNVIGLQASDWPEPAQAELRKGRVMLESAGGSLREARAALHKAVEALRRAIGGDRLAD